MSENPSSPRIIEVVAGVLMRPDGGFMLGSRPEGKPYAGYWEFPGGKVEPGESHEAALARELDEEMGIEVLRADYWLTRVHHYEHASVRLRFYRVWEWRGEPRALEGQRFAWAEPGAPTVEPMLPANGPILKALSLPSLCAVTDVGQWGEAAILARLSQAGAPRMVLVREPELTPAALARFVGAVAERVHAYGGLVMLYCDDTLPDGLPVDGLHLSPQRLLSSPTRPAARWVGASADDAGQLAQAAHLALDYVFIDPGLPSFASSLSDCAAPMPLFAQGELVRTDLDSARRRGAHGIVLSQGMWA